MINLENEMSFSRLYVVHGDSLIATIMRTERGMDAHRPEEPWVLMHEKVQRVDRFESQKEAKIEAYKSYGLRVKFTRKDPEAAR